MAGLTSLKPQQLHLDLENPRFGLNLAADEDEAIEFLLERADIRELWDSIIERGYEPYEPLVAFESSPDNYTVVEGNRRLAAIRTLLDPSKVGAAKIAAPPEITAKIRATMGDIPVYVVDDRADADSYIGYKHINGPNTWGAFAKAKFASKLFDKLPAAAGGEDTRVAKLSRRLGDGRQLILRSLVAFRIIQQAISEDMISQDRVEKGPFEFSHLYTVLQNRDARSYLGLGANPLSERMVVEAPIPHTHLEQLRFMMRWLFGDEEHESVIKSQGTDRPRLQKVLASEEAIIQLQATHDFEAAVSIAGFDTENWISNTIKLEALSKKVIDGISDLPEDLGEADIQKADKRLEKANRNIEIARSALKAAF
ncbi:MAG: hypothetical protein AB7I42_29885 [Bradyrhizobium sp.]|uniref:hypothetical protein n=1 Tax=Bradyrhizobium sp. TaxID=376 RepID=UPI003D0D8885